MAEKYKIKGSTDILFVIDVHPIIIPQLKVKPKKSCGQYVILFMKGYANAKVIELIPSITVSKLNCKSIKNESKQIQTLKQKIKKTALKNVRDSVVKLKDDERIYIYYTRGTS